jgi:hypothetical protein
VRIDPVTELDDESGVAGGKKARLG